MTKFSTSNCDIYVQITGWGTSTTSHFCFVLGFGLAVEALIVWKARAAPPVTAFKLDQHVVFWPGLQVQ